MRISASRQTEVSLGAPFGTGSNNCNLRLSTQHSLGQWSNFPEDWNLFWTPKLMCWFDHNISCDYSKFWTHWVLCNINWLNAVYVLLSCTWVSTALHVDCSMGIFFFFNCVMSCHSNWWWYNLITKQCLNISSTSVLHKLDHLVIWLRIRLQRMKDNCWICSESGNHAKGWPKAGWWSKHFGVSTAIKWDLNNKVSVHPVILSSTPCLCLHWEQLKQGASYAMTYGSMKSAVFML